MTYVLAFVLVLAIFAAMAVGLVLGGKPIRGSCGGINCKLCAKPGKPGKSGDCPRRERHSH